MIFQSRIEHTIGKQPPGPSDDRAKSTVLARMQRVEGTINDMGQTMENIFGLLKNVDEKLERISPNSSTHSTRPIPPPLNVKFASANEEIP